MPINSKVVLVTGASRGIGNGIANWFINNGYNVAFGYKKNIDFKINASSSKSIRAQIDISDRTSIKKALNEIETYFDSNIDILINNAAIAQEKKFEDISDKDWNEMMAVNLRGAFSISQEVLPMMKKEKWGRIINISSVGGQLGGYNQVHYAASKAALINLTISIAKLYSANGITCNCVAPGLITTEMSSREILSNEGKTKVDNIPLKRVGTVSEIVDCVGFLASENASYITGQTININGGMYFG